MCSKLLISKPDDILFLLYGKGDSGVCLGIVVDFGVAVLQVGGDQ